MVVELMDILVVDNAYLYKYNDSYFSKGIYDNEFFNRYLSVFERVVFPAKVIDMTEYPTNEYERLNTSNLCIVALPLFKGIFELIKNFKKVKKILIQEQKKVDLLIFRMTQVEGLISFRFMKKKKPFALEIINDIKTLSYIKYIASISSLNKMLKSALGVTYLTEEYLQGIYKYRNNGLVSFNHQTSDLKPKYFNRNIKLYTKPIEKIKLIHVANNIDNDAKGYSTIIKALKVLKKNNKDVTVTFVGSGTRVKSFKKMSKKLGVEENVQFIGRIDNKMNLIKLLKEHDIFVMPSKGEGLGRSIIEAMATGLPCIVSNKGGQIELISKQFRINRRDYHSLANLIIKLGTNYDLANSEKIKNVEKVEKYKKDIQEKKRYNYYVKLKEIYEKKMVS